MVGCPKRRARLLAERGRAMTNAEKNAKWKLAHGGLSKTTPLVSCIPRGNVDLDDLERAASTTLALYDKLVLYVEAWIQSLGDAPLTTPDGIAAFRILPQALESLAVLRAKISEQRGAEARNVTSQMQTNLEASRKREAPKIEQTLELLRSRFSDIKKPKAT
jgi:hypothetical protein